MKKFSELNVKQVPTGMVGDKIKVDRILNKKISVHNYKIVDSKFKGKCLHLQIQIGDNKHVVFTSAKTLQDAMLQIEPQDFPFETTIVKEDERLFFT